MTCRRPDSNWRCCLPPGHWGTTLSALRIIPRAATLLISGLAAAAAPAWAVMPPRGGSIPPEVSQAITDGRFEKPAQLGRLSTSATRTVWNVPVILVAFSDQPFNAALYPGSTPAQRFERQLFDTTGATATGSVFDYYQWVSGQRVRVVGKVVATVTLPNPKDYYANNGWGMTFTTPRNLYGFARDALVRADSLVDWRPYDQDHDGYVDIVWFVHSGLPAEASASIRSNLWSCTSRLSTWPSGDRYQTMTTMPGAPTVKISVDRFSVLPELSAIRPGQPSEIGVYCHEFGHALGLPDLYDTSTFGGTENSGLGNWNLMATGGYGSDGTSPEYPANLGAWSLVFLGWRQVVRPTMDTVLVQNGIARGDPLVELWFQGESNPEHFLVENRQREGFDRNIPREGLLVYHVNEPVIAAGLASNRVNVGSIPGLRLVEADGLGDIAAGRNRGDDKDPFPGLLDRTEIDDDTSPNLRSFYGGTTGTALRDITPVGEAVRYLVQARAPGWRPAARVSSGVYNPVLPSGGGNRGVLLADRSLAFVTNEIVDGHPQVVLRTRPDVGDWDSPTRASQSPSTAIDPTIAALPGGNDLVLVWSDTRDGAAELYYRSRIGGVWTSERRITNLVGESRYPSVCADAFGRVYLAWLYTEGAFPQVRFMSFSYFSPFGTPLTATQPTDVPSAPVVVSGSAGNATILWSDRATGIAEGWISTFTPSAGLTAKAHIYQSGVEQSAVDAAADASGAVHIVWQESGTRANRIHYQRRLPGSSKPSPLDAIIVSRTEAVQNPTIRVDGQGVVHVGFVAINSGVQQVRYIRGLQDGTWEVSSTEVTLATDGPATRPAVVPSGPGDVAILYQGFPDGTVQLMERRRNLPAHILSAAPPIAESFPRGLRLGPNPLRAGAPLVLEAGVEAGARGIAVDVFDLTGRRVLAVPLIDGSRGAYAELPGEATRGWSSGIYFARLRGAKPLSARLVVVH